MIAFNVAACSRAGSPRAQPRAHLPVVVLLHAVLHMSSMKVMVGGAESASVTRTSGVCHGCLSRALKVPHSSSSFWRCFLISRAWRALQVSWPDRSRHCARPRGCRPMIVEETQTDAARPRLSLSVSHARAAHASGSLRPTRAPRNLCMKSGCFDRPDRKIFSLRGPTMVGRAASRAVTGFPAITPLSDTYWDFGSRAPCTAVAPMARCIATSVVAATRWRAA